MLQQEHVVVARMMVEPDTLHVVRTQQHEELGVPLVAHMLLLDTVDRTLPRMRLDAVADIHRTAKRARSHDVADTRRLLDLPRGSKQERVRHLQARQDNTLFHEYLRLPPPPA